MSCTFAILACGAYVAYGLRPFQWNPPRWLSNGVRQESALIRYETPGLLRTYASPSWVRRAKTGNAFTMVFRVRPFTVEQCGPARILTISADPSDQNFMIAQSNSDLVIRLRTPESSEDRLSDHVVHDFFSVDKWQEFEIVVLPESLQVISNETVHLDVDLPADCLSNWKDQCRLALGNDLAWKRPWLGEISRAITRVGDWQVDYVSAAGLVAPRGRLMGLKGQVLPRHRLDALLNFICFTPVGFLIGITIGRRKPVVGAAIVCGCLSLGVESLQICFDNRYPSVADFLLNVLGASVGAIPVYLKSRHG